MKTVSAIFRALALIPFFAAQALPQEIGEIDENALFSDTAIIMVDSADLAVTSKSDDGIDSTVASFSGGVTAVADAAVSRDWFSDCDRSQIDPSALMLGDLMLDVRLPLGIKAFIDAETVVSPDSQDLSFAVPELFLDANINRRVYFRAGKQVLQWGRGYFWNPTDLINVERKTFIEKIGSREGTFGLKTHVPFGTKWNIYGFMDMNDLSSVDSLAGAARIEALFGGTEAGVAVWGKRGKKPIAGFDISASIGKWSITGEMSLTDGSNYTVIDLEQSGLFTGDSDQDPIAFKDLDNDPVVRLCAGFMRNFDFLDIDDRILVVGEFYYNQIGDNGNGFKKYRVGERYDSIMALPETNMLRQAAQIALLRGFEFNSLARYYGAFFVTINEFIADDLTLQFNGLVNFNHRCAMLTAGLTYTTLHNFTISCLATGYAGPEESEYTFTGTGGSLRLTAGVTF